MARYQTLLKALVARINAGDNKLSSPSLYSSLMASCNKIAHANKLYLQKDYSSLPPASVELENVFAVLDALTVVALARYAEPFMPTYASSSSSSSPSLDDSVLGIHCFPQNHVIQKNAVVFHQILLFVSSNRRLLPSLLTNNVVRYVYRTNYFVVPKQTTFPSLTSILTVLAEDVRLLDARNEMLLRVYNERGYFHVVSSLSDSTTFVQPQMLRSILDAAIRELPKSKKFPDDTFQRMIAANEDEIHWGRSNTGEAVVVQRPSAPRTSSRFRDRAHKSGNGKSTVFPVTVAGKPTQGTQNEGVATFSRYKVPREVQLASRAGDDALASRVRVVELTDFLYFCFAFFFIISKYLTFISPTSKAHKEDVATLQDFLILLYPEGPSSSSATRGAQERKRWIVNCKELSELFLGCVDHLVLLKNFASVLEKRPLLEQVEYNMLTTMSLSPISELSRRGMQHLAFYASHLRRFLPHTSPPRRHSSFGPSATSVILTRDYLQSTYSVLLSKYAWSLAVLSPTHMDFIEVLLPILPFRRDEAKSVLDGTSIQSQHEALSGDFAATVFAEVYGALASGTRFYTLIGIQALLRKHISSLLHYNRVSLKEGSYASSTLQITNEMDTVTQLACIATHLIQYWKGENEESDVTVLDVESFVCIADIVCGLSRIHLLDEDHKRRENGLAVLEHMQRYQHLLHVRIEVYAAHLKKAVKCSLNNRVLQLFFWFPQAVQLAPSIREAHGGKDAMEDDLLTVIFCKGVDVYAETVKHIPQLVPPPQAAEGLAEDAGYMRDMERCLQSAQATWAIFNGKDDSASTSERDDSDSLLAEERSAPGSVPASREKLALAALRASIMHLLSRTYENVRTLSERGNRESFFLGVPSFFALLPQVALTSEEISAALPNLSDVLATEMEMYKSEMQALASRARSGEAIELTTAQHLQDATVLLQRVVLLERTCVALFRCGTLLSLSVQYGFVPLVTETLQCVVDLAGEKKSSKKGGVKAIASENVLTTALRRDPGLLFEVVATANTLYFLMAPHFTASRPYRQLVVQLSKLCFISSLSLAKSTTNPTQYSNTVPHDSSTERHQGSKHPKSTSVDLKDAATQDMYNMCLAAQQLFRFVGLLLQHPLRSLPSEKYIKIILPIIVFRAAYAKLLFRVSRKQRDHHSNNGTDQSVHGEKGSAHCLPNARTFGVSWYMRSAKTVIFHIKEEDAEIRTRKLKRYYLFFTSLSKIILKNKRYYDRYMKEVVPETISYIIPAEETTTLVLLCDSMQFFLAKEDLFDDTMKELFQLATSQLLDALESSESCCGDSSFEAYLLHRGIAPLNVLSTVFRLYVYVDNVKDVVRLVNLLNRQMEQTLPLLPSDDLPQPASPSVSHSESEGESEEAHVQTAKNRQMMSRILQGLRDGNKVL